MDADLTTILVVYGLIALFFAPALISLAARRLIERRRSRSR